ncbi:hypothetical protein AB595_24115 [Massilia sp. WF1]|uniref:PEP-CTERM sorting domain-containing protein n=1 Tax=unclassified Massilia TaxID=2609279 RepID=UPI00068A362E|nr:MULTISPECIES: PEP-CTERM sorting domain-containing protein [unclassified Massilia]ALK95757.1 hypothetical protein AM586_05150 [Massilia sp. WG5]KNZ68024.1 hypothetical protein AB595_24115 [Massilia sp. WF1]
MNRNSPIKQFAAAILCAASLSAGAQTLTFTGIGDLGPYPESWTESGFIITSLAPPPAGPHLHAGDDNLLLHSQEGSSPYQIRRLDGGAFDFLGFDYSGGDSVFVTDTGASFTIPGDQPMAHFTMSAAFQNVSYVNWIMNTPGDEGPFFEQWGTIDNVVLSVPEPSQTAMLGLGLCGLLLRARRSRRLSRK